MAAIIPIIVGLGALGALAFAGGSAKAAPAAATPETHKPKRRGKGVKPDTEAVIISALRNPAAMKKIIDSTAATGDAVKLWNLGRTMLLNAQGLPNMQAAAAQVLANAVSTSLDKGTIGDLLSTVLANGDAGIFIGAAKTAGNLRPDLAQRLRDIIAQVNRSSAGPEQPVTRSPGQPTGNKPATTRDDQAVQSAAQAATQVVVDAIKATEAATAAPADAPLPASPTVQTLPEVVITPGPSASSNPLQAAAQKLTDYLRTTTRFHEDKGKVGSFQSKAGLGADGNYGPASAKKIASLGVVPVPPFYWTKGKAPAQKQDYKRFIADMADQFPFLDFAPALKGVDAS